MIPNLRYDMQQATSMKALFMRTFLFAAATGFALAAGTLASASAATPAPKLTETSAPPVAEPYPDTSLAHTQVQEAFKTAAKTHRRVLLVFGGNWCPDCKMLAGIFALPDAAQWLENQFVIVPVNVGRINTNLDLAQKYGVTIKAVPTVIIITPEGHALNGDGSTALGNARSMSPQAVIDLISEWNSRK
ncbi:thioredoxin family protein [Gluconobacter wancherniae]|nr:thioredoxin family protein [Gluconobacter wancherniae]GBD55497.1 thioredoxin family protein [Gluconobacter wancherniae NBRC 103581]GBR66671.1 protein disulfide isomerase [Gluconobacter wancherniae NBRC 103581]